VDSRASLGVFWGIDWIAFSEHFDTRSAQDAWNTTLEGLFGYIEAIRLTMSVALLMLGARQDGRGVAA
jgi:hypothetical protein